MKKVYYIFLIYGICSQAFSQKPDLNFPTVESLYDQNLEEYHYLLADSINVRDCASINCKKLGILKIGERIVLQEKSETIDTINNIKSHWYKIKSKGVNGWIFGGFIAQQAFGSQSDSSVKFVYGLKRFDVNEKFVKRTTQLRAFENNKELDQIELPISTNYINSIKTIGNSGLELKDIIIIEIPCVGGCGCSTGNLIIFWNGKKFSKVYDLLGTADAWASESYRFIYPTDMEGINNTIIKVSEFYIGESSDGKIERGISKEYFKWNGEELVADKSKKVEKKTYLIEK